jgi:hypothetical protein
MPRKRSLLSVRSHLEHAVLIEEGLAKYGLCPAIEEELKRFFFVNRAILRANDKRRAKGDRKDIYLGCGTL